jgi:methyltransferase (TIGR00027 family)
VVVEEGTPSATARAVAQVRAAMDRPVTAAGDGDVERRIVERFPPAGRSAMADALERRTRWFDGVTLRSIEGGITQVVIVAAGYDCRALRFRTPGVRFFELDHTATQTDKRNVLVELGADTGDVSFAAADFTHDDVGAALEAAGHDARLATLFLVEGLLIYLELPVIETLLRALRARASDGSRLAVSMSRTQAPAFYARVAAAGEQAHSSFDELTAGALLERCGWTGDTSRPVVLATPLP